VDVALDIYFVEEESSTAELMDSIDERGAGGTETYSYEGTSVWGDTGYYVMRLYSVSGSDCDESYLFKVEGGG
jgi:hypothetical protein